MIKTSIRVMGEGSWYISGLRQAIKIKAFLLLASLKFRSRALILITNFCNFNQQSSRFENATTLPD
jgi:hypothetical protein